MRVLTWRCLQKGDARFTAICQQLAWQFCQGQLVQRLRCDGKHRGQRKYR